MKDNTQKEVLCFGRIGVPGHSLHSKTRGSVRMDETPWNVSLDAGLLKRACIPDQIDGKTITARKDGWTAICFWDRSGDDRPCSNTAFLIKDEDIPYPELMRLAQEQWPEVFSRPGFPLAPLPESQPAGRVDYDRIKSVVMDWQNKWIRPGDRFDGNSVLIHKLIAALVGELLNQPEPKEAVPTQETATCPKCGKASHLGTITPGLACCTNCFPVHTWDIPVPPVVQGHSEAGLLGEWRHSYGFIFCGTLRIAKGAFDTNPAPEFCASVFDDICAAMNQRTRLQTDLENARGEAARLSDELNTAHREYNASIGERDELRRENERLTQRLSVLASDYGDAVKGDGEIDEIIKELAAMREALQELASEMVLPAVKRSANSNRIARYGQMVKQIADKALSGDRGRELLERLAEWERVAKAVSTERDILDERCDALKSKLERMRNALVQLKSACEEVLLPAVNEAVRKGAKVDTWIADQFRWINAVQATDEALKEKGDGE